MTTIRATRASVPPIVPPTIAPMLGPELEVWPLVVDPLVALGLLDVSVVVLVLTASKSGSKLQPE